MVKLGSLSRMMEARPNKKVLPFSFYGMRSSSLLVAFCTKYAQKRHP